MKKVKVSGYKRTLPNKPRLGKRGKVGRFERKKRKKGKKKIVEKTPVKLYPIRDEFGQFVGYSNHPPRKAKPKSYGSLPLAFPKNFGSSQLELQGFKFWHKFKDDETAKERNKAVGDTFRNEFKIENGVAYIRSRKKNYGFTQLG